MLSIVIPAYNEQDRISSTIDAYSKFFPDAEIIIIADGTDRTAEIAKTKGLKVLEFNRRLGKGGAVEGLECVRAELGKSDRLGRRNPIPIDGSSFNIKTDTVISTVNREPDLSLLGKNSGFKHTLFNTLIVDPNTLATGVDGIFASGDCATGPKTTIEAIAGGRRAARNIDY